LQQLPDKIKASLIEAVGYFDLLLKTILTTDAGPGGLSTFLKQYDPAKDWKKKIIMCISRLLMCIQKKKRDIHE
jgi:hypothetical protein